MVHDAELARWIDARRVDVDPIVDGNYFRLDFMSSPGGSHPAQIAPQGDGSSGSGNGNDGKASGEMNSGGPSRQQQSVIRCRGPRGKQAAPAA